MTFKSFPIYAALLTATSFFAIGCNGKTEEPSSGSGTGLSISNEPSTLTGMISVDGSSTVLPILERMAEDFNRVHKDVKITVGSSGTGGGFKKFCKGEIDIADASRAIEKPEIEEASKHGIEFVEIPIAFDGLSVVVNPQNDFASTLTVEELKKIWEPNSKVKKWSDVRAGFPAEDIKLYGPGTDSGTFDSFTKAIVGEEKSSRSDYQASEDDNTLVTGVAGDKFALGYFGYAYYDQNRDKLKVVGIDAGKGAVEPTPETIGNGTYLPLSRPLFIYVSTKAMARKEVKEFVNFILQTAPTVMGEVGYVPLSAADYGAVKAHVDAGRTGTLFNGVEIGVKIEEKYKAEAK